MLVWERVDQSASMIVDAFSSRLQHAMMHDVLWLVSYEKVGCRVMFSTISRKALIVCVGQKIVDAAMKMSGSDRHVILIVPSCNSAGEIVFALTATFLRIQ